MIEWPYKYKGYEFKAPMFNRWGEEDHQNFFSINYFNRSGKLAMFCGLSPEVIGNEFLLVLWIINFVEKDLERHVASNDRT